MSGLSEFSLIKDYFEKISTQRSDVLLGIGDDCAIVQAKMGQQVAISVDTLVEGIHFLPNVDPESLGHKSLAVSLSDLAAMGATPAWFTLALTLPEVKQQWLEGFAKGLAALANQYQIALIGGDTTKGPLSITIQVNGFVKKEQALRRNGAKLGDDIYVSGTIGDAGAGLKLKQSPLLSHARTDRAEAFLHQRLDKPTPRVELGQSLLNVANAAIDISDGLVADLGHILGKSHVGATIDIETLPISSALAGIIDREQAEQLALYAGDDYELCFTVPPEKQDELNNLKINCTKIGTVTGELNKVIFYRHGQKVEPIGKGYEHFSIED
jgi:thiamine-monophosphate kinase